jgi:tRNA1(Val) A37 N6-methylase TrmN6
MTPADRRPSVGVDVAMDTTRDDFLGGALLLRQPKHGYRAGLDAVLLAATVSRDQGGTGEVLDCGSGVGTVGLSIASRCTDARVTLVEKQHALAALAEVNIVENGLQDRVRVVEADVTGQGVDWANLDVADNAFATVVCNPPFHIDTDGTASPQPLKAVSHAVSEADLDRWMKFLTRMTAPRGRLTMIHKTEALPRLLAAFDRRFGAITVLPVHPRSDQPANRVIVSGIKGSRAALRLVPGLILHDQGRQFTPEANDILRHGAALPLGL